jgi:hypothetical protein
MNRHFGIILKHYAPKKNKCALLDEKLGRITGIVMHDKLSAGTVLQYELKQKQQWYIMEQVEIIDMPFALASHDMLFLHYILEMCYHFIPDGSGQSRLYDLLIFMFKHQQFCLQQKKRVLCVMLALLDLYPEDAIVSSAYLYALAQEPLEQMINAKIDINVEKNISGWLYQCVRVHTDAQQFKTIHFLDEIR